MPLAQGQVINNRYRIDRLLGLGGFGAVYQAWDQNLLRRCALKENLDTTERTVSQFQREAVILANLNHPNLPRVSDHFVIPGQGQYLVMDYIEGEDLQERLERAGHPLPEAQALDWVVQVCDALAYMHQQIPPIIHRDIKPANIRITPQGKAMLVDFGIAKAYDPHARTTVGARAVTPGFSPPEQYGQGSTDERSDIYALGATLYTLLTGQTPPESVDLMSGDAPPLSLAHVVNPEVDSRVSQEIARAMSTSKTGRFQHVDDFKAALLQGTQAHERGAIKPQFVGLSSASPEAMRQQPAPTPVAKTEAVGFPGTVTPPTYLPLKPAQPGGTKPRPIGRWVGIGALLTLAGCIVCLASLWLAQGYLSPEATPTRFVARMISPTSGERPIFLPSNTPGVTLTATFTPSPTVAPTLAPLPGAVEVELPQSKVAFVSNHRADRKERIYVQEITGASYWFEKPNFLQMKAGTAPPFTAPLEVPADESHDMAWWPEWCDGNQVLLFEVQDTANPNFQTIYTTSSASGAFVQPAPIQWSGYSMLGVPRCSNKGKMALVSALQELNSGSWELFLFNLTSPNQAVRVGNGFAFAGYAGWSADDRWAVFMHKGPSDTSFNLIQLWLDNPANYRVLPLPEKANGAKYPAVSPSTDEIAFACPDKDQWNLCIQDSNDQNFRVVLENLGSIQSGGSGRKVPVPAITPRWSPDGKWIAYASNKDGDWDVYLYSPVWKVEYNLTADLAGDQFEPSWSKP